MKGKGLHIRVELTPSPPPSFPLNVSLPDSSIHRKLAQHCKEQHRKVLLSSFSVILPKKTNSISRKCRSRDFMFQVTSPRLSKVNKYKVSIMWSKRFLLTVKNSYFSISSYKLKTVNYKYNFVPYDLKVTEELSKHVFLKTCFDF